MGREPELAAVEAAFAPSGPDAAVAAGVLLVGEAGVGRTRLAREVEQRFRRDERCRVEWVSARMAPASVAFGAVAHLLPDGDGDGDGPEAQPAAVIAAVARRFAAGAGRVVLVVDDADRLDPCSAALVAHLAVHRGAFVVATARRARPAPGALAALWRDGLVRRLEVGPLPPEHMERLIDAGLAGPGPVDAITRRRLLRVADGRPATLRDLLGDGAASGVLRQRYGAWSWDGPVTASWLAVEKITADLAACPAEVRAVLEIVAFGEPLTLAALGDLADHVAVEAAEELGLVQVRTDGRRVEVRLSSPLHGEVIRDQAPVLRARRICGRLAERLAATPLRRDHDQRRLAALRREAGEGRVPVALFPTAQQEQQVLTTDPALAEVLGERERLGLVAPTSGDHAEVLGDPADGVRSWLLLFDGHYEASLRLARSVLTTPGAGHQAVIWAAAGGVGAAGVLGRLTEAMQIRQRGLAVAATHRSELPWAIGQIECATSAALHCCGHVRAASEVAEASYRAAAEVEATFVLGISAMQRGFLATAGGRPQTAQTLLREAAALLDASDTGVMDYCLAELDRALALAGGRSSAGQRQVAAPVEVEEIGALIGWQRRSEAWVHVAQGDVRSAMSTLRRAAAASGPAAEAHLLYDAARLGAAAQVGDRLGELVGVVEGPFVGALATCARCLAGEAGLAQPAVDDLVVAADELADLGHPVLAAEAFQLASRAYRRLGLRSRAQAYAEHAAALLDRCEQVTTPLLVLGGAATSLTPREREVALLAVHHTSRTIAGRLGLAVSTVDNHLARVYVKLGVGSRRDLPPLLGARREPNVERSG